jgi:hypothetical protein
MTKMMMPLLKRAGDGGDDRKRTGRRGGDVGRMTTQLGTPRGRYDEHSIKFSLSKKLRFVDPVGKSQT